MDKVYVVSSGTEEDEDYDIHCVFTTKELAIKFMQSVPGPESQYYNPISTLSLNVVIPDSAVGKLAYWMTIKEYGPPELLYVGPIFGRGSFVEQRMQRRGQGYSMDVIASSELEAVQEITSARDKLRDSEDSPWA